MKENSMGMENSHSKHEDIKYGVGGAPIISEGKKVSAREGRDLAETFLMSLDIKSEITRLEDKIKKLRDFIEKFMENHPGDADAMDYTKKLEIEITELESSLANFKTVSKKIEDLLKEYDEEDEGSDVVH